MTVIRPGRCDQKKDASAAKVFHQKSFLARPSYSQPQAERASERFASFGHG
jgi:hypothetical protein